MATPAAQNNPGKQTNREMIVTPVADGGKPGFPDAHAAVKADLQTALPTNLAPSGFRTRFAPNGGTPQEYLDELMPLHGRQPNLQPAPAITK